MQNDYQSRKIDLFVGMVAEMISEYISEARQRQEKGDPQNE